MSRITDFFEMNHDQSLLRIWGYTFEKMEKNHDWIQWVFPLEKPSQFNPDAPILTQEDIEWIKGCFEFEWCIGDMLDFMGITYLGGDIFRLSPHFKTQKYVWCEPNHNSLRITRFLASLSILGREKFAAKLLDFMLKTHEKLGIKMDAVEYWKDALLGLNRKM